MTVKYASPKAEAEAKVRAATHALTDAQIRLDQATARDAHRHRCSEMGRGMAQHCQA